MAKRHKGRKTADWMETENSGSNVPASAPYVGGLTYDPDAEFEAIGRSVVKSPVILFQEAIKSGRAKVAEAYLFEGRFDRSGKLMESAHAEKVGSRPYVIRHVVGHAAFMERAAAARSEFGEIGKRAQQAEKKREKFEEGIKRLREAGMIEGTFDTDDVFAGFDAAQYTEYAPTYAGPFNKQLYTHDYLTMHARAFEAKNHHPIAKRIIDIFAQYAFGRRFKTNIEDEAKKKAWEEFDENHNIVHRICKFWSREYPLYGELMVDKKTWQSIDPSTVADIITDPDDITKVYYYHQMYSTAYQTFTGQAVPGVSGSKTTKPIEYIVRQLPFDQVIHLKANVVSQEKRGRSLLFPILGWLKRVRDLINAKVLRAQVQSSFIFDDKITGSAADVAAHAANYAMMPRPMSVFVHNENIERTVLQSQSGSSRGGQDESSEILGLIATAAGIPKQFFNVMDAGSGSRVGGLVGAEPFEKVIEDMQSEFQVLLDEIFKCAMEEAGLDYEPGDVEWIFPSVTKDTTTETVANIMKAEANQSISHETASQMIAGELNITTFNFEDEQEKIKARAKEMPVVPPLPPNSRFAPDPEDASPIHGDGKRQLKKAMSNL